MPLKVSLVSADAEVWSGEASIVVARTVIGEIGLMAGHEPVLGILAGGEVRITETSGSKIIAILGVDELSEEDKIVVSRARRIQQFLSQNTYMAKKFTGVEGSTVPIKETIESFDAIVKGDYDHVAEQAFFNVGGIADVEERWAQIQKENG